MRRIALVAMLVSVAACGGKQDTSDWKHHLDVSNEITALWTQIRQWRSEAKLELDPPASMMQFVRGRTVGDLRTRTCPANHAVPQTCNDVCSIADNICDNAERICELATELGKDDSYGQQKCTSAKASCREAKQRCCGCAEKTTENLGTGGGPW